MLAAVTWVGGAIALQVLAIRIKREGQPARMADMAGHFEWIGLRLFTPASLLLLILGVWMVLISDAWDFDQLWIIAAIAMFGYSFVTGAFYLSPNLGRLKRIYAEQGLESPAAMALTNKLFVFSRIELVLLILIVFDMVLKPGV